MGVAPSASAISRLNRDLEQQFQAWRERRLQDHWRILYLDGIHFSMRHGDKADATMILTALGVDMVGNKDVLALRACAEESKDGWSFWNAGAWGGGVQFLQRPRRAYC